MGITITDTIGQGTARSKSFDGISAKQKRGRKDTTRKPIAHLHRIGPDLTARLHYHFLKVALCILRFARAGRLVYPGFWLAGKVFGPAGWVDAEVDSGIRLQLGLYDPYWMPAVLTGAFDEEIEWFLGALPPEQTLLVDCGANIGWVSLVGEKRLKWRCVAVEAAAHLVEKVSANRRLSHASFDILHKAIWRSDDEPLTFMTDHAHHAGGHVASLPRHIPASRLPMIELVRTVTIDTIVREWREHNGGVNRIVIKLDVEGAEAEAILGGARTLRDGAILIYEDHGAEPDCRSTEAALAVGLKVFSLQPGRLTLIRSVEEVRKIKTNRRKGYNFVAVSPEHAASLKLAAD